MKPVALTDAPAFPNAQDVKVAKLLCADVGGNNNKFYTLTLQTNPKGLWRCLVNYGRVGAAGRFEVRAHGKDQGDAEEAFDALYAEKTRKGRYREVQIVADGGKQLALPAKTGGVVQAQQAWRSGARAPASWSPPAQKFYNELLYEAQCMVETGMQASSVSSAGLQTPLGIVGETDIRDAQKVLDDLADVVDAVAKSKTASTFQSNLLESLNSQFFKLIPTPIGSSRVKLRDQMITTAQQVADKQQLLDSALGLIAAQQPTGVPGPLNYPVLLEDVDPAEGKMLTAMLRKERCRCHDNQRLEWKSAFRVTRPADVAKFRKDLAGKLDTFLFHGTRRTTAAGILSRGLLPTRAATAAGGNYSGSAYGDGIYFASNAGKSLGYTGASAGKRVLFVALVAMGKVQRHDGWSSNTRRGTRYDSIHAVGGNGLAHDEMIVPSSDRTCLAYVMEV